MPLQSAIKNEVIIFGSPVPFFGNFLHPVEKVRNQGVLFDVGFSFVDHVLKVYKNSFNI